MSLLQLSQPRERVGGLPALNVTSLTINAPEGQSAKVVLGSGEDTTFSVGVHADGTFAVTQGKDRDVIAVSRDGDVVARTQLLAAGALSAQNGFVVDTVSQWALWREEDFSSAAEGWSTSETTRCGAVFMLGGTERSGKAVLTKKYTGLPKHQRVRVTATFHFIDLWQGETGYMQVSSGEGGAMEYAWTDRYELKDTAGLLNVCGKDKFGEGKFAVPIDVTIYHTGDDFQIAFGTTLTNDDGEATFGVSGVSIHVRSL